MSLGQDIRGKLPSIMADRDQIQRVLINLLENAFDSMDAGGEVKVNANLDTDRNQVVIEVSDEGKGIPVENKEHIFSPYFSTKFQGSGLGLAICHRIVDDHNGTIIVRDNKPQGSIFRVNLPVASPATAPAEIERTAAIG